MAITEGTAALITAGMGAASGAANIAATAGLNRKNRKWQEKMYQRQVDDARKNTEDARKWALSMFQLENEYNAPAAQVARLKKAGLNPNLVYGNGNAVTSGNIDSVSAANTPSSSNPSINAFDFSPLANSASSALAMYQNWRLNNLNMQNIQKTTEGIELTNRGKSLDNELRSIDKLFKVSEKSLDLQLKRQGLSEGAIRIFKGNLESQALNYQNEYARRTLDTRVNQAQSDALISEANVLNAKLAAAQTKANIDKILSDNKLLKQQYDANEFLHSMGLYQGFTSNAGIAATLSAEGARRIDNGFRSAGKHIKNFTSNPKVKNFFALPKFLRRR